MERLSKVSELSQRVDIRLGYRCNARCRFCCYARSVRNPGPEPSTREVRELLNLMRKQGATEVEFTGGEPTVREDLHELAAHAKRLGFINISLISNGLRLSDLEYARKLVDAGVNDFLFSIHGHTEDLHDRQTQVNGAFKKILTAVENVQSLPARCRSTTTLSGLNYRYISDILAMMIDLDMKCVNVAVFSPVSQASNADKEIFIKYTDVCKYIKKAIHDNKRMLPTLSVKYIPFCFMMGHEQYVMNFYQQNFDPDDWNLYLSHKARRPKTVGTIAIIGAMLLKNGSFPAKYGWPGLRAFGIARCTELIRKRSPRACLKCSYYYVCDHVWREYLERFGDSEIVPISGSRINDPAWCYQVTRSRMPGTKVA